MRYLAFLLVIFLAGCGFSDYRKNLEAREKAAILAVQGSDSIYPEVDTLAAVGKMLQVLELKGRYVKIIGWSCNLDNPKHTEVQLAIKINDNPDTFFKWAIEDNMIKPMNDLAQNITPRQPLSKHALN